MESWISLRRSLSAGLFAWMPGRRTAACGYVLGAFLITCEIAGRALGLHTPVLYEATAYGYRVRPQQDIRRFGNRIHYDQFGLRSDGVAAEPAAGVLRVLCLGDSITNGGAITDQAETYPVLLQQRLNAAGMKGEVLNASAPGWAIANEAGWLRMNGTFGSHAVLLTIGTTDLFQEKAAASIVDHHPSFPSQAPAMAIEELWSRYAMPHLLRKSIADPGVDDSNAGYETGTVIAQVMSIAELARQNDSVLLVLYVERPGREEPTDPRTTAAKALLFDTLKRQRISYVTTRDAVDHAGGPLLFRDGLHPNTAGNGVIAHVAFSMLAETFPGRSSAIK